MANDSINLNALIKGNPKELEKFLKVVDNLNKSINLLGDSIALKKNDVNDFIQAFASANPNTKEGITLINRLTKEYGDYAKLTKQIATLEKQLSAAREKLNGLDKETLREKIKLSEARREATKDIKDEIRASKLQENSLDAQRIKLAQLKKQYAQTTAEQRKTDKATKELTSQIQKLTKEITEAEQGIGVFNRNVGNYKSTLDGLGLSITKIGGTALAIEGLTIAFNKLTSLNKDLERTRSILNDTGADIEETTAAISALSDTFNQDFNEVLQTANTLSRDFGETQTDVVAELNKLFAQNANISGDLLDNLREYAPQMRRAGATLADLNRIALASAQNGFFDDKLYDTVKEGMLRIAEATEDTNSKYAKSLKNLGKVGEEISKTFASGDRLGAIQKLAKEIQRLEANGKSAQKPLSELFGAAGEDLGVRGLEVLATLDKVNDNLTEQEKRSLSLVEANKKLNSELLGLSTSLQAVGTSLQVFFTSVASSVLEAGNNTFEGLELLFKGLAGATRETQLEVFNKGITEAGNKIQDVIEKTFGDATASKIQNNTELYIKFLRAFEAEGEAVEDINALYKVFFEQHIKARKETQRLALEQDEAAFNAKKLKEEQQKAAEKEALKKKLEEERILAEKLTLALTDLEQAVVAIKTQEYGAAQVLSANKAILDSVNNTFDLIDARKNEVLEGLDLGDNAEDIREQEAAFKAATEQADKYKQSQEDLQRTNEQLIGTFVDLALEQAVYAKSFEEGLRGITVAALRSLGPLIAQGIAGQLSQLKIPPPAGLVVAGGVVATMTAILGRLRGFKDGVFDLNTAKEYSGQRGIKHPTGKKGIDTIPAWLNNGETVVQTEQTNKYSNGLEAIVSKRGDKAVLDGILKDMGKTEEVLARTKYIGSKVDYAAIIAATREGVRQGYAEQAQYISNFDAHGATRYIKKGLNIVKLKNLDNGF